MDQITALTILANTIETCLTKDMPAANVFAALNFLASRIPVKWPFLQFQEALNSRDGNVLNSALPAITLLLRVKQRR